MSPTARTAAGAAAVTVPPVLLAVLGLVHPHDLTAETARWWRDLHLIALPLWPLLGVAPWLVLRRAHPRLAVAAAVLGYVYAACYTGLDLLAGVGAGSLALAGRGGAGVLFDMADTVVVPGVVAYLVAAVLAAVPMLRRAPALAVPGAVLAVGGAVSFLTSHIYWPQGVLTMLALAAGWTLLLHASRRQA